MANSNNHILIHPDGGNTTPKVISALEMLNNGDTPAILEFEAGAVYDFFADGAHHGMFYPSNNTQGEKTVIFPLLGHHNLTINGNGAKFLFHDRVFPIILQNTSNIILKDFTLDFSFPRYGLAELTAIDDIGFTLKCLQKDIKCNTNADKQLLIHSGQECFNAAYTQFDLFDLTRHSHAWLISGKSTLKMPEAPAATIHADAEMPAINEIRCKYHGGEPHFPGEAGDRIVILFDEGRENDMIFLDGCSNTTIEGVVFARGAGMGIVGQRCHNVSVHRCQSRIPDERQGTEVMALTADILHFVNCDGRLDIENNQLEDSLDDALNVHGIYTRVKEVLSSTELLVEYCHWQQACTGIYCPNDSVVVSDHKTLQERGRVSIAKAEMQFDHHFQRLTLQAPPEFSIQPGDLIENPDRMPAVRLCNNVIRNCPNIRMSSPQHTEISGNLFALSSTNLYICDLLRYWFESGRVRDVTIENNIFCDVSEKGDARGIVIEHRRGETPVYCHENISILNNRFLMRNGASIFADHINGLRLEGNTITHSEATPVTITNCQMQN